GPQQRGSPARASTALSPGFAACESSRITPETAACEAAGDQETKSPGDVFVCCSCSLDLLASCCARSREHPYATKPSPARNNGVQPARASAPSLVIPSATPLNAVRRGREEVPSCRKSWTRIVCPAPSHASPTKSSNATAPAAPAIW